MSFLSHSSVDLVIWLDVLNLVDSEHDLGGGKKIKRKR